jgi:proline racemase
MMSGGFLYPPCGDADAAILFIETSGCLPMCGHGTIGMITFGIEHGLIQPRTPGTLVVAEVPAGQLEISYTTDGNRVTSVKIRNVPSLSGDARDRRSTHPALDRFHRHRLWRQFLCDHRTAGRLHWPRRIWAPPA